MGFNNMFLSVFGICILILVYCIDAKIKARRAKARKFDYLFTDRRKYVLMRSTKTKGRK